MIVSVIRWLNGRRRAREGSRGAEGAEGSRGEAEGGRGEAVGGEGAEGGLGEAEGGEGAEGRPLGRKREAMKRREMGKGYLTGKCLAKEKTAGRMI